MLRYIIVFAIYLLFSKDWKSVSHMFMINRLYFNNSKRYALLSYIRAGLVTVNEYVIFRIAFSIHLARTELLGL